MEYVRSTKPRPPLPDGPWLVVGLARSGIAAARALKARGEAVFGVDSGTPEDLSALDQAGIGYATSTPGTEHLAGVKSVVKSPGVPSGAEVILEAEDRGLTVIGELELGWRLVESRMIAITGTNGKTTTTELVSHIFRNAARPIAPAGNVGHPLCDLAPVPGSGESPPEDLTVVCECSSFQLEDTTAFSPEVAVHLNLSPDHLDRHGDLDAYQRAKLNIFRNQVEGDVAILNSADPALSGVEPGGEAAIVCFDPRGESDGGSAPIEDQATVDLSGGAIRVDGTPLVDVSEMRIRGPHNVANAMAAAAASMAMGLDEAVVADGLRTFDPVPHRFEPVARIEGVDFINDSKATNVDATVAALGSFEGGVHLILGGSAKGEPFDGLVGPVARSCRGIYVIGETADEIADALGPAEVEIVRYCGDLETAVSEAGGAAVPGETVLLSPACASFDQFRDYEHRGDTFREMVRELDAG
ncbi:MAG: UDP-N-acetylmuramoyl-L-alanine--D-glutamate ligase [Actinomycetota bacterium]|nr:UDP-N-acetylmuramoyl-L-alanine--D-glutamate ligase [Actinomycetota bacterium]